VFIVCVCTQTRYALDNLTFAMMGCFLNLMACLLRCVSTIGIFLRRNRHNEKNCLDGILKSTPIIMTDRVAHVGPTLAKSHQKVFETSEDSYLAPFFGSNVPGPRREVVVGTHPCADLSRTVHACLDEKNNHADFCTPTISRLELCLRETQ
jgi:hypothetical protein